MGNVSFILIKWLLKAARDPVIHKLIFQIPKSIAWLLGSGTLICLNYGFELTELTADYIFYMTGQMLLVYLVRDFQKESSITTCVKYSATQPDLRGVTGDRAHINNSKNFLQ